jgi:hypothetical protein
MVFQDDSFNIIVKLYFSYQFVYYMIHIMNWFSWWNCKRGGVDRLQKSFITRNVNLLVPLDIFVPINGVVKRYIGL